MRKNYKILAQLSELRITQAELARQASISSEARLSRIIHYLVYPTKDEAKRISKVLGISVDEIRGNNEI